MILIEFYGSGKKVDFPESLAECNQREYEAISRFVYLYQSGKISLPQFQRLSVYALLNVKPSRKPLPEDVEREVSENVAFLSDYVMNFFEMKETESETMITIKQDYIHNPMPSFKINEVVYEGPRDNFEGVTFGQYMEGLGAYLDYEKFREEKTLVKLLSIFYKPKSKIMHRFFGADFSKLSPGILYGFFLYFASFQKWISSGAVVHHDGIEINLSIIFEGETSKNYGAGIPGLGMKSLFHSIAESGVFGPAESLKETPLWDVLFLLYEMRKKSLDEKAEADKIRKNAKS